MRRTALILLVAVAFLDFTGCKSSTAPPPVDDLVGTWDAIKAEFTSVANSSTKVDIIAQGWTLVLVFSASTFTMTIQEPGQAAWVRRGTWSISYDMLVLTWYSEMYSESQFDFNYSGGSQMTLEGGHMPHEFTSGNPEEAIVNLILTKR